MQGDLPRVQQLFRDYAETDPQFRQLERVFRWACMNGHLHVAQFLLDQQPNMDICAGDHIAYRLAGNQNQLAVVQWLSSLNPNYSYSVVRDANTNAIVAINIQTKPEPSCYLS